MYEVYEINSTARYKTTPELSILTINCQVEFINELLARIQGVFHNRCRRPYAYLMERGSAFKYLSTFAEAAASQLISVTPRFNTYNDRHKVLFTLHESL